MSFSKQHLPTITIVHTRIVLPTHLDLVVKNISLDNFPGGIFSDIIEVKRKHRFCFNTKGLAGLSKDDQRLTTSCMTLMTWHAFILDHKVKKNTRGGSHFFSACLVQFFVILLRTPKKLFFPKKFITSKIHQTIGGPPLFTDQQPMGLRWSVPLLACLLKGWEAQQTPGETNSLREGNINHPWN